MSNVNLKEAKNIVEDVVKKAFAIAIQEYKFFDVQKKEFNDIVTSVDTYMEEKIISTLKTVYPNHFFSSEELGEATIDEISDVYEWVIDPIDGTINFAAGLPYFTTSVCLKHNDEIVLGVIVHHSTGDVYTAIKGNGAYCNERQIHVSDTSSANNSILSFMLTSHYNESQTDQILSIVRKLSLSTRGLRLFVSQAYEMALIASGLLDGTVCIKSRGFSSSAGSLLVSEAGGKVTDLYGKERTKESTSLLVSNGKLHNELVGIING